MTKSLLAAFAATAALMSVIGPAAACPAGYVAGWVQGHKICHIRPGGNGQLTATTTPQPGAKPSLAGKKTALRAAQRAMD